MAFPLSSSSSSFPSCLLTPNISSSSLLSFRPNFRPPRQWTNGVCYNKLRETNDWRFRFCAILQAGGAYESEEDEEDYRGNEQDEEMEASVVPERWDVLGLGQAMIDFSGMVDNEFLHKFNIEKGTRKVIHHEERGRILSEMDGSNYKAAAGGSLSNTLVALARLGGGRIGGPQLNVAMAGSVGSDMFGSFYRSKLRRANVHFLSKPVRDDTTGTVIVLTTPDAQRTMLAYQGTSSTVNYDPNLATLVSKTKILIIEGYLFEFPHTIETIKKACEDADQNGALIAVTASDVSCIKRCYDDFWHIIGNHADILFANLSEARALSNCPPTSSPITTTTNLSRIIPLVSVTDGQQGSYLATKEEITFVPPSPCFPIDTCGAGDSYASGILYGKLRGVSELKGLGRLASRVASIVVGQQGTRLSVTDAEMLAMSFDLERLRARN